MKYLKELLTGFLLLQLFGVNAQNSIHVFIRTNGYRGSFFYFTDPINPNSDRWFYINNSKGDTSIVLPINNNQATLYTNSDEFDFLYNGTKVTLIRPALACDTKDTLSGNGIVLSLKLSKVKLKSNGLDIPYKLATHDYSLVKGGETNTISRDSVFLLIKDMNYVIKNQSGTILSQSQLTTPVKHNPDFVSYNALLNANSNLQVINTPPYIPIDFVFTVDSTGMVQTSAINSAKAKKQKLKLKTSGLKVSASDFGDPNKIKVEYPNDGQSFSVLPDKKAVEIKVIDGLLYYFIISDRQSGVRLSYFYFVKKYW